MPPNRRLSTITSNAHHAVACTNRVLPAILPVWKKGGPKMAVDRLKAYDRPGTYQIVVLGDIAPRWSRRLEGMSVTVIAQCDNKPITALSGEVRDQAALVGVLNTLFELHLSLLSVQRLAGEAGDAAQTQQ
jgi:hypothetical protein